MADAPVKPIPRSPMLSKRRALEEVDIPDPRLPPLKPHAPSPPLRMAPDEEIDSPALPIGDARAEPPGDEPSFTRGPARRPVPRVGDPLVQWASGLPTNDRRIYAGWLVEAGKAVDLDDAMGRANVQTVAIKHGGGNVVTHWALPTASLFVLCDGVQAIGEMKLTPERFGIAFGWRTLPDGRAQSQLRARVMFRELLSVGYAEPLLLTVKGTLTGDLLAALTRQYDVLDACAQLRAAAGKPPDLPFYAFSIPLGPGAEVTRGSGSATKAITPIVALTPPTGGAGGGITKEYILAHWIKRAWVAPIEGLLDATIAWAIAESAAIAQGADDRPTWDRNGGEDGL